MDWDSKLDDIWEGLLDNGTLIGLNGANVILPQIAVPLSQICIAIV